MKKSCLLLISAVITIVPPKEDKLNKKKRAQNLLKGKTLDKFNKKRKKSNEVGIVGLFVVTATLISIAGYSFWQNNKRIAPKKPADPGNSNSTRGNPAEKVPDEDNATRRAHAEPDPAGKPAVINKPIVASTLQSVFERILFNDPDNWKKYYEIWLKKGNTDMLNPKLPDVAIDQLSAVDTKDLDLKLFIRARKLAYLLDSKQKDQIKYFEQWFASDQQAIMVLVRNRKMNNFNLYRYVSKISDELKKNEDFMLELVKISPYLIEHTQVLTEKLILKGIQSRLSAKIVANKMAKMSSKLTQKRINLRTNMLIAIRLLAFEYKFDDLMKLMDGDCLKLNHSFGMHVAHFCPGNILKLADSVKNDPEVVLAAVSRDPRLLADIKIHPGVVIIMAFKTKDYDQTLKKFDTKNLYAISQNIYQFTLGHITKPLSSKSDNIIKSMEDLFNSSKDHNENVALGIIALHQNNTILNFTRKPNVGANLIALSKITVDKSMKVSDFMPSMLLHEASESNVSLGDLEKELRDSLTPRTIREFRSGIPHEWTGLVIGFFTTKNLLTPTVVEAIGLCGELTAEVVQKKATPSINHLMLDSSGEIMRISKDIHELNIQKVPELFYSLYDPELLAWNLYENQPRSTALECFKLLDKENQEELYQIVLDSSYPSNFFAAFEYLKSKISAEEKLKKAGIAKLWASCKATFKLFECPKLRNAGYGQLIKIADALEIDLLKDHICIDYPDIILHIDPSKFNKESIKNLFLKMKFDNFERVFEYIKTKNIEVCNILMELLNQMLGNYKESIPLLPESLQRVIQKIDKKNFQKPDAKMDLNTLVSEISGISNSEKNLLAREKLHLVPPSQYVEFIKLLEEKHKGLNLQPSYIDILITRRAEFDQKVLLKAIDEIKEICKFDLQQISQSFLRHDGNAIDAFRILLLHSSNALEYLLNQPKISYAHIQGLLEGIFVDKIFDLDAFVKIAKIAYGHSANIAFLKASFEQSFPGFSSETWEAVQFNIQSKEAHFVQK